MFGDIDMGGWTTSDRVAFEDAVDAELSANATVNDDGETVGMPNEEAPVVIIPTIRVSVKPASVPVNDERNFVDGGIVTINGRVFEAIPEEGYSQDSWMGIDGETISREAAVQWAEGAKCYPIAAQHGLVEWIADAVLRASDGKSSVMEPTIVWDWT